MTRSLFALTLTTFALLFAACGGGSNETPATSTAPAPAPVQAAAYPSIDFDKLAFLWDNATYMDATFYNLPISINQSNLDQIRSTIATVAEAPMTIKPGCTPTGHIWFQVNGKNVEEADLYFQPGCTGYVWYEEGKPARSNELTEGGVNFYQNIVNSVPKQ